jgi:hypothetical protein
MTKQWYLFETSKHEYIGKVYTSLQEIKEHFNQIRTLRYRIEFGNIVVIY